MAFPSRHEYESLIYGVAATYPEVVASTLRLYSTSALTAVVEGEVQFNNGLKLRILEILDLKNGRIQNYSYAIYRGNDKIRWYDPQPHPENPALTATYPHHFHEEPDIKHNRQPAKGISFEKPNLPVLIADCLALGR
ncbi:MAG TPA: DUF6516 family protein [Chloroflexota bacterium]|nr:DUF6516 family protein [Chloroflexota bacterium]HUM70354.1 DUF6516 family protein [Chloroflexota bacterium]